ncbi:hypothetical protein BN169_1030005 [Clostridioides difficile E16]|nr:hypothetical protein BN169_1030005 [Clostridioides difficile E16]VTT91014.1 Hypothetical protein ECE5_0006 [Clostridioides difficile]
MYQIVSNQFDKEGISADTSILNEIEKSNVELIKDLESN